MIFSSLFSYVVYLHLSQIDILQFHSGVFLLCPSNSVIWVSKLVSVLCGFGVTCVLNAWPAYCIAILILLGVATSHKHHGQDGVNFENT